MKTNIDYLLKHLLQQTDRQKLKNALTTICSQEMQKSIRKRVLSHYKLQLFSALSIKELAPKAVMPVSSTPIAVALSKNKKHAFAALTNGTFVLSDIAKVKEAKLKTIQVHNNQITAAAFSRDSCYALTGSQDATACVINLLTGNIVHTLKGHTAPITSVAFSRCGDYAMTGSIDSTARIWDLETGKTALVLKGHTDAIQALTFDLDGIYALTGSQDTTARIWNLETGKSIGILQGHNGPVNILEFYPAPYHPNAYLFWQPISILTASTADTVARLWDWNPENISQPQLSKILEGHTGTLLQAMHSPDHNFILTSSQDETVRLWYYRKEKIKELKNHTGTVQAALFSRDERYVLTGSREICLWSPMHNAPDPITLKGHIDSVTSMVLSSNGSYALTGACDNTLCFWDLQDTIRHLPTEQLLALILNL